MRSLTGWRPRRRLSFSALLLTLALLGGAAVLERLETALAQ